MLRQEEDSNRCRTLQIWQGSYPRERQASRPGRATDHEIQGVRARTHPWIGQIL